MKGQKTTWNTNGNANQSGNCFIGTTDPTPLILKSGGTTQMKIAPDGSVRMASLTGTGSSFVTVDQNGQLQRLIDNSTDSLMDCSVKLWRADGNHVLPYCFIGSTNKAPLRLVTHGTERLRVTETGQVGIGTIQPNGIFQIGDVTPLIISENPYSGTSTGYLIGFNARISSGTIQYNDNGPAGMVSWDPSIEGLAWGVVPAGVAGQGIAAPPSVMIKSSGNVGIGEVLPKAKLHVKSESTGVNMRLESGDISQPAEMEFWAGPFGINGPTAHLGSVMASYNNNKGLSELIFKVNNSQSYTSTSEVFSLNLNEAELNPALGIGVAPLPGEKLTVNGSTRISQSGTPDNYLRLSHNGTHGVLEHHTSTSNSNATSHLQINPSGNPTSFGGDILANGRLGIGTSDFQDTGNGKEYRLSVDGRIRAREVKVYSGWADYVFETDYDLMPLNEVAEYIETHGHLPGVPSAEEVETHGVDVGATQVLLLEKVEELTLHLIKLEEENRRLQEKIRQMSKS